MLFSSPAFLFLFLPLILAIYFLSPKKLQNFILLIFSLAFYSWGEKLMVVLLLLSAIVDFCCGLIISKGYKKFGLLLSLVFNLGILIYFKYASFLFDNAITFFGLTEISDDMYIRYTNIVLPLGISFFTFQTMSYTVDVYRGKVEANKNIIDFATYVCFFPQLIAGPIVRYSEVSKFLKKREVSSEMFSDGIKRFIIGLSKK